MVKFESADDRVLAAAGNETAAALVDCYLREEVQTEDCIHGSDGYELYMLDPLKVWRQRHRQQQQQQEDYLMPKDASTCVSNNPRSIDAWCRSMCARGACTADMCVCDGEAAAAGKEPPQPQPPQPQQPPTGPTWADAHPGAAGAASATAQPPPPQPQQQQQQAQQAQPQQPQQPQRHELEESSEGEGSVQAQAWPRNRTLALTLNLSRTLALTLTLTPTLTLTLTLTVSLTLTRSRTPSTAILALRRLATGGAAGSGLCSRVG